MLNVECANDKVDAVMRQVPMRHVPKVNEKNSCVPTLPLLAAAMTLWVIKE